MEETRRPDPVDVLSALGKDKAGTGGSRRAKALGLAALLGVVAAVGWYLFAPGEAAVRYRTEAVARHALAVNVTATGQLAPVTEVDVGSELSGTIARVEVDYNDMVKQGQVLATLDTAELDATVVQQQAALKLAQARVEQAAATLDEATLKYNRTRNLVSRQLASQEDLDTSHAAMVRAQADLSGARAQVAQAGATLDAVKSKLAKSTIRSPINGIVLSRSVEPGQTVAASFNTPVLFSLAEDLRHMELHVDVDEADVGHLAVGQAATFTVDAWPGREFTARVTQVRYAPRTVEGVVTYETLLSVDNEDLALRPGMTATAEITVANLANALLVPNQALRFTPPSDEAGGGNSANLFTRLMPRHRSPSQPATKQPPGKSTVWVLSGGEPHARTIQTGMTDGRYTEVRGNGIEAGEQVITGLVTRQQ